MATSGSTDFQQTAQSLIKAALRKLGVIGLNRSIAAEEQDDAIEALNRLLKSWQADGLHLWLHTQAVLFPTPGTAAYPIPGSRIAKASDLAETTVASAAAGGTVTVTDATGIADGDVLGVALDSGSFHWTTVSGAPVGSVITLTDALPSAAAEGNVAVAYTSVIARPNRITQAWRRIDGQDIPLVLIGRRDYFDLPNKGTQAVPLQLYYDPQRGTGTIYLWPTPDDAATQIRLTYSRPIEDIDNQTDDLDLPVEWHNAIVYNLAIDLAPEYGLRPLPEVIARATEEYQRLLAWDREPTPITFEMDYGHG